MMETMGPYLVPSAVVGLGPWGAGVAGAAGANLRERSPALARACPVLAVEREDQPGLAGMLKAHLKATRLAEVIRGLEREGLMRLDPVVAPATHLYLVLSMADDPRLMLLKQAVAMLQEAAADLKAAVQLTALVDLGEEGRPPDPVPAVQIFVMEAVTSQGLVLDPAEYRAAAAEVLVAAAQPGGSQVFAAGPAVAGPFVVAPGASGGPAGREHSGGGVGTLGIAWVGWSQVALRQSLARRLARDAVLRCLEAPPPAPWPMRQTEVWQAQGPEARSLALLAGLPFAAAGPGGAPVPTAPLFGDPARRRRPGHHLRRCAAVLDRRLRRWEARLRQNAAAQAEREARALDGTVAAVLAQGPDGLARTRALLAALGQEAGIRAADPPPNVAPRPAAFVAELTKAERLPDPSIAAMALGLGWLLFSLLWWLMHGSFMGWLSVLPLFLVAGLGYTAWRPWRIRQVQRQLHEALLERAAVLTHHAYSAAMEELDQALEQRSVTLAADLEQNAARLRDACLRAGAAPDAGSAPPVAALSFPLIAGKAAEPLHAELQPLTAEAAAHVAGAGVFRHLGDPDLLLAEATEAAERYLAVRTTLDPGQLAARAYGDRLAERLRGLLQGLLDWSQPLVAVPASLLPEGQRWLLWPEGLPCPPVPAEVNLLPHAIGCAAALTVVPGLPAGIRARRERKTGETSA
jgi:hypothetical protein